MATVMTLCLGTNGMNEKEKIYIRDLKVIRDLREQQTINRVLEQRINALADRVKQLEKEEKISAGSKK